VDQRFRMHIHVPKDTEAEVHIPESAKRLGKPSLDGKIVQEIGTEEGANNAPLFGPGDHDLVVPAGTQDR
jgi:hypothetical protein